MIEHEEKTNREIILPEGVPPLTTYYIYLTAGCNLACRHCWIAPEFQAKGTTGGYLTYEMFVQAIAEGLPLGLTGVKFTGGEPLLNPDFIRMADYATSKGITTWMETNGTLLTREVAFHLKTETSLESVSVSLDGATPESHEYMRNVSGAYEQALQGISYLVDAGYSPQIIMSLHSGNVDEIEPLARWAKANGCSSIKINLIQTTGRGQQMEDRGGLLPIEKLVQLGKWVTKELQPTLGIPIYYDWPVAMQPISSIIQRLPGRCSIHNILGILSDGSISICGIGTTVSDLLFGQLGMNTIESIWCNEPVLIRLRRQVPNEMEGVCGDCLHKSYCLGSCVANTYHENGSFTKPFWFCERAKDAGLFPASRLVD